MKNIGIIGHFGGGKNFTDGQTVKTKEINFQIEQHYDIKTMKFDTYKNSHNPFKLLSGVKHILKKNDFIILVVSQRGYKIISLILYFLNKFYKKQLFDFVIGGTRYKIYDKSKIHKKAAKSFKKIYVETENMKKEYNKRDLFNVVTFPNFKKIERQPYFDPKNNVLKLCTFTRIRKEKGIEDAIKAVEIANKKIGKNFIELDLYGIPDKDYVEAFDKIQKDLPSYIKYKGLINPNESPNVIKQYDLMLFLTFWRSEGFPGTIIDAFFAGIPVMATDWNRNFEVLKENHTGIKVKVNSVEEVADKLVYYFDNRELLLDMRKNCLNEAEKYIPENIMKLFYKEIDE